MPVDTEKVSQLIKEADEHDFKRNCYYTDHGVFSRPSPEMQAWIADIEDFIRVSHGENSSPWRVYKGFSRSKLDGQYEDELEKQKGVLVAALQACLRVAPAKQVSVLEPRIVLARLFERFHSVTRRLRARHAERATLDVKDEYDVQDLLAALLRINFSDIRTEEWTPSYAGGSARMDFLLKDEQIVIEVKMTRKGLRDRELGNQLIEDVARYQAHPDCLKLICFVYDPDGFILNPDGIRNDLSQIDDDFEVQIVIRPEA